jgi:murein DD-endopeptidase MepM/ murein hydrolase activator NlpD
MEDVSVAKGEKVKAKQAIGTVMAGEDGDRSELHFEVWKGASILNPQSWLKGR